MEQVQVFAPASVANVGPGYDTFGFAIEELGDIITLTKRDDKKLNILPAEGADLPMEPENNVASVAINSLLNHLGSNQGVDIHIKKLFKPGSGLGSSASSASGAVFAVNELLGRPYEIDELLNFALVGEALASGSIHADNVAPALFGGFQVARSYEPLEVFELPTPDDLCVLIIFPDVEVKTSMAKGLIPKELSVKDAREQWGNVGALIHAMHSADYKLLSNAIQDRIAEPHRKQLIPYYDDARQIALTSGAVGFNISGSGPSMFSFFQNREDCETCKQKINALYGAAKLPVLLHMTKINPKGCVVIS